MTEETKKAVLKMTKEEMVKAIFNLGDQFGELQKDFKLFKALSKEKQVFDNSGPRVVPHSDVECAGMIMALRKSIPLTEQETNDLTNKAIVEFKVIMLKYGISRADIIITKAYEQKKENLSQAPEARS